MKMFVETRSTKLSCCYKWMVRSNSDFVG